MNATEEEDLNIFLQRFTTIEHAHNSDYKQEDVHSSDEFLKIYKGLADSPPLYAESTSDMLSAPSKPTYVINLRPEQEQTIPAAIPPIPVIQTEQVPAKLFKRLSIHTCKVCQENLTSMDNLHLHYAQRHPHVVKFNCEVCTEPYLVLDSLRKHLKRKHNVRFNRKKFLNHLSANE